MSSSVVASQLLTGPYFLGNLLSYGLFGVLALQVYIYIAAFPKDRATLKWTVAIIVFLDVLVTVLSTILGWHALVIEWGSPTAFAPFHWSLAPLPLMSSLVGCIAQSFYAWRIYCLQSSPYLPLLIMLLSLTSVAFGGFCGIRGQIVGIARDAELKPEVIVWLSCSTLCDLSLTAGMVVSLYLHRQRSKFVHTRSLMSKLITLTIETGMVTAVIALLELILFLLYPLTNMHFLPFLSISKLYSNCLLATLNARTHTRARQRRDSVDEAIGRNPFWIDIDSKTLSTVSTDTPTIRFSPGVTSSTSRDVEMLSFEDDEVGDESRSMQSKKNIDI